MTKIAFIDDDGSLEAYTVLLPMLEKFGFKGSFAVVTNRIGRKGYMNKTQLLDLQQRGHEILSHSKTHPHMTDILLSEAAFELQSSKTDLENMDVEVNSFVFPFNEANTNVSIQALRVYDWAFVGEKGNHLPGNLKRVGVGGKRVGVTRRWVDQADSTLFLYGHSRDWNKLIRRQIRKLFKYISEKQLTIQTVNTILKQ